ncbi:TonB-dependent receptor plug domain-containing protein [Stenotrophomonas maltophilia]|uniref:TonB-dependent receptor plug domain-containing protein n=1 Tax=Stenotrophomonas maltophilia TaxID=40324 RepID=UPI001070493C|nr:TonB-dependent receptor [Stenotrophomonas maltophilia]
MHRSKLSRSILLALSMASAGGAIAAEADAVDAAGGSRAAPTQLDAMLVTGTRASNRTQFETLAPVDVFTKEDIRSVESTDLKDVLAQLVPSFVVQRLPMADGQVFVRPATLRGLSPDQTLVLVNGRRFHRSALLGNRGAQAADLAQIPTSAIKRIEVLRDGASAQYGSDAIAGVINIILEEGPGTEITAGYSQYAQGDGASRDFSARTGWSLGDYGSLVLFAESSNSDATSRTRQRPDAIAFQAAHPELEVPDPVQRWGQPELESRRVGFNVKANASGTLELYAFGLYSHSDGVSDFNWRNPDTTTGAYRTTAIFPGWNLRSLYPVGFSPQYGNVQNDLQLVGGLRGEITPKLRWDVSASYGRNAIDYSLKNSINASLGPASPTAFDLGRLTQTEKNANADFNYEWEVGALSQPINVAFGGEFRQETYQVRAGDPASYAVGPGAAAGLEANSNGAPGFSASQAGQWSQRSKAAYVDMEVPLGERWSIGAASRYEDFSSFGSTLDGKLSARFAITPDVALRGTVSSGFRAPTPAQLNTTSTTQGLDTRTLQIFTSGRLSPDDPLAQLLGARPLKPEESRTASMGLTWRTDQGLSGSVDVYQIKLSDRFSQSASFAIPAGTPNPLGYTSVNYFTNDFDTTTTGVDVVGNYLRDLGAGRMTLTLAYNYNRTRVDNGSTSVATNETQRVLFEDRLPEHKGSLTGSWDIGTWSLMARMRYYGAWTDSSGNAVGDIYQRFGAMSFLDLAVGYRINEHHSLRVGADNVFDRYPDEATFQASRGLVYSRNAPYDTDGANLYAQYRLSF